MMRAIVGTVAEAWSEVRVHKARFILSAFGVFLAVIMMTTVQAVGAMATEILNIETEQATGRPGTVTVFVEESESQGQVSEAEKRAATAQYRTELKNLAKRFQATHYTLLNESGAVELMRGDRSAGEVHVVAVEPYYAELHRISVDSGRFVLPSDSTQRAVQAVITPALAKSLDIAQPLTKPVALRMAGTPEELVTVVGVVDSVSSAPAIFVHIDQAMAKGLVSGPPNLEIWAGEDNVEPFVSRYGGQQTLIPGATTMVQRTDEAEFLKIFDYIPWVVRFAALVALGLTSIGVLNVGIVTVRNRVREIGIRRSYGATDRRVFATIMLESVLSSFLAAVAGVAVSVALLRLPWYHLLPAELSITTMPAFPAEVALEAVLLASTVGALAGLIPAMIAVKAKVIEAIRF